MTVPGRLEVGPVTGKVGPAAGTAGPARIDYNSPWPCANGSYGSGKMQGLVEHTMVGDLPGTVAWFNNPKAQASAHFGVAEDGAIHQFGPIGKGWCAWAQAAGNLAWYSCEFADGGSTQNPLTQAQIIAGAQLLEVLSRFAGFPLAVTDSVTGAGLGTHVMGGAAWGGHTCPGPGPRAGQRPAIVELAKVIRAGAAPPPVPSWKAQALAAAGKVETQLAVAAHDVAALTDLLKAHQ
jgi:hypothetical protein